MLSTITAAAVVIAADPKPKSGGSSPVIWILLAALVIGMFWMSNRTRKTQRKAQDFRSTLAPGQEVVTASGMIGTIVAVEGDEITIESVPGAQTRWIRGAISRVVEPAVATDSVEGDDDSTVDIDKRPLDDDSLEIPDDLSGLPEADSRADGDEGTSSTK